MRVEFCVVGIAPEDALIIARFLKGLCTKYAKLCEGYAWHPRILRLKPNAREIKQLKRLKAQNIGEFQL